MNEQGGITTVPELEERIKDLTEHLTSDESDTLAVAEINIRMRKICGLISRLPMGNGLFIYLSIGEVLELEWADNPNLMDIYLDTMDVTLIIEEDNEEYRFNLEKEISQIITVLNRSDKNDCRNTDSE